MALNRAFRLRKNTDFQRVRQQGRSYASRLLILACAPNDQANVRIGLVVSRRVSKHAVKRNYVKRVLSEAIRPVITQIPAGWDIVLSAKYPILDVPFAVLQDDVQSLLRRSRLFASSSEVKKMNTRKG